MKTKLKFSIFLSGNNPRVLSTLKFLILLLNALKFHLKLLNFQNQKKNVKKTQVGVLIVDVSEVKLSGEAKQNNLPPECGQLIEVGVTSYGHKWVTNGFYVISGLLDRKWMEQRDRALADKQEHEDVIAPGISIGSNLKRLSERRTDIFGVGAEETQIGKKVS
jgi:hypothetical protein